MEQIVLFSGGLDSSVMLALALQKGEVLALTFDYGQRHRIEIERARELAHHFGTLHQIIQLDMTLFKGSALTDLSTLSKGRSPEEMRCGGVPTTYVPGRNTLFLAYALSIAEGAGAKEIYFGANLHDRDGYPDCRPEYVTAFQKLIDVGTTKRPKIVTPLLEMDKRAIWKKAGELKIPTERTWSCYDPVGDQPCRGCDACVLRLSSRPEGPIQMV